MRKALGPQSHGPEEFVAFSLVSASRLVLLLRFLCVSCPFLPLCISRDVGVEVSLVYLEG